MTEMYMVCRFVPAILPCLAYAELTPEQIGESTYYAPALNKPFFFVKDLAKAEELALELSSEIHDDTTIDLIPYTDYGVFRTDVCPMERQGFSDGDGVRIMKNGDAHLYRYNKVKTEEMN